MKIGLSFRPGEEDDAAKVLMEVLRLFPRAKVRKSNRHPPFSHIYLTTKMSGNPCNDGKNH